MDPIALTDKVMNAIYKAINIAARGKYCLDYSRYKSILKRNEKFRNIGQDKICYILGNGPSLKLLNPSYLQGKDIFTVNGMVATELFDILKPKYHCIVDRGVFADYPEDIKKRLETSSTIFFLHRELFKEWGNYDNTYFLYGTLMPVDKKIKIDITKNSNCFINVIAATIMVALYMGYKTIVLLGCDFSFFAVRKDLHFYDGGGVKAKDNMFQALQGGAIMQEQLSYLGKYALDHGIKIFNATPGSLLDVFPQVPLEELI